MISIHPLIFIHLSIYPNRFICSFINLTVYSRIHHLFIYQSIISICLSLVHIFNHLPIYLSIICLCMCPCISCLSISLFIHTSYVSIHLFIHQSIYSSICLFISSYIYSLCELTRANQTCK